jgi:hypothetical protein
MSDPHAVSGNALEVFEGSHLIWPRSPPVQSPNVSEDPSPRRLSLTSAVEFQGSYTFRDQNNNGAGDRVPDDPGDPDESETFYFLDMTEEANAPSPSAYKHVPSSPIQERYEHSPLVSKRPYVEGFSRFQDRHSRRRHVRKLTRDMRQVERRIMRTEPHFGHIQDHDSGYDSQYAT